MVSMSSQTQPICDIRLPPEAIERILNELDKNQCEVPNSKRRSERFRVKGRAVIVTVISGDHLAQAPEQLIRVRLRNISQHGFAFLSGIMIPPEGHIKVDLPIGKGGEPVEKLAVVRRCRHVTGMVHEIGAEFGWPIEE